MQKLLDVQDVDLKIETIEVRAAAIPDKFEKWRRLVEEKRAELEAQQGVVEEARKALRHSERSLEEKQEEKVKYDSQLPLIKTNREYTAILLEIDLVEKEASNIEEAILEGMAAVEEAEAETLAMKALLESAQEQARIEKEKLDHEQEQLEESLRGTRVERNQLAADVDGSLLSQYDRIRTKRGGLAIARINDESCGACHILLPPQVVNEVIGQAVKVCPNCHRLLCWMEA